MAMLKDRMAIRTPESRARIAVCTALLGRDIRLQNGKKRGPSHRGSQLLRRDVTALRITFSANAGAGVKPASGGLSEGLRDPGGANPLCSAVNPGMGR